MEPCVWQSWILGRRLVLCWLLTIIWWTLDNLKSHQSQHCFFHYGQTSLLPPCRKACQVQRVAWVALGETYFTWSSGVIDDLIHSRPVHDYTGSVFALVFLLHVLHIFCRAFLCAVPLEWQICFPWTQYHLQETIQLCILSSPESVWDSPLSGYHAASCCCRKPVLSPYWDASAEILTCLSGLKNFSTGSSVMSLFRTWKIYLPAGPPPLKCA